MQRLLFHRFLLRLTTRGYGQCNGEIKGTALTKLAFQKQFAAHQMYYAPADGQPQASALTFGNVIPKLLKTLKGLFLVFRRNAYAGIHNLDGQRLPTLGRGCSRDTEHYASPLGSKFEGIGQQIQNDLPQPNIIANIAFLAHVALHPEGNPSAFRAGRQHALDGTQQLIHGKRGTAQGHLAAFDAAHVQNIVDQAQQIPGG